MILTLKDFKPYIELTKNGYIVHENCPTDKLKELKKINEEYKSIMGKPLFIFHKNQKD